MTRTAIAFCSCSRLHVAGYAPQTLRFGRDRGFRAALPAHGSRQRADRDGRRPERRSGRWNRRQRRPGRSVEAKDGTFEFLNVPPGDCVIQARAEPSDPTKEPYAQRPGEFATAVLTVGGDEVPISLQTAPGSSLKGRVVAQGGQSDDSVRRDDYRSAGGLRPLSPGS
jgi:hypothetical protein